MTLADRKDAARRAALARRRAAFDGADAAQADLLCDAIRPHLGRTFAGFRPIRTEIDPTAAMVLAGAHGAVGVPVIVAPGAPLVFHRWTSDTPMRAGPFGAHVPVAPDPVTPDVLIVPLVAFDRAGGRLGYGGGFYDRTLEQLRAVRPTLAIGFAFAAQQADDLPLEPTDQPLDMIVTESGIIVPDGSLSY